MKMRFFELAKRMSHKSDHSHKIGGVLVKKNKVLSVGFNKCKTHTKSNTVFRSIHCELDCILGAHEEDIVGATIYLYRQNKSGIVAISKPCIWCQKLLKDVGISKVCYTDHNGYKEENV